MRSTPLVDAACARAFSGDKCAHYAQIAWRNFRRVFVQSKSQLPLVEFDPHNWKMPFKDVSLKGKAEGNLETTM